MSGESALRALEPTWLPGATDVGSTTTTTTTHLPERALADERVYLVALQPPLARPDTIVVVLVVPLILAVLLWPLGPTPSATVGPFLLGVVDL